VMNGRMTVLESARTLPDEKVIKLIGSTGMSASLWDAEGAAEAVEGATEAATEAADTATEAATEAADTATEAATEAADTATEATDATTEAASDAIEATTEAAGDDIATLLTKDGFDADKIVDLIEDSSLTAPRKELLKTAIKNAAENPVLLDQALARVKSALGM